MMEVLQFIFQDFWHWLGALILLSLPCSMLSGLVRINFTKKNEHPQTGKEKV